LLKTYEPIISLLGGETTQVGKRKHFIERGQAKPSQAMRVAVELGLGRMRLKKRSVVARKKEEVKYRLNLPSPCTYPVHTFTLKIFFGRRYKIRALEKVPSLCFPSIQNHGGLSPT
jgi:hypothetical protein